MKRLLPQPRSFRVSTTASSDSSSGFVMLTVLIFMVILMIVAIASMRSTKDEISIAGSRYFRNQAYQSAQSALVLSQRCISVTTDCGQPTIPNFDGTVPGWLDSTTSKVTARAGNTAWMSLSSWTGTPSSNASAIDALPGLASPREPRYVVEKIEKQIMQGGSLCDGCPGDTLSVMQPFRLTARGFSPNDGSTVLLQRHVWTLAP